MGISNLQLIDLDQELEGYRRFISCWVYRDENIAFVVDPGPRSTVPKLVAELGRLGVERLDFALVTHIHIDHGGGAAELLTAFPEARVFCHESGMRHVESPKRLWEGSLQVLGEVAKAYLEPNPISADAFCTREELQARGFGVIDTPGHAVHHVSYLYGGVLFAGEALGTRQPTPSGLPYLRPATPPRFFLDVALASIEKLASVEPEPSHTAFAHYGLEFGARVWCERARGQILHWVETMQGLISEGEHDLERRLFEALMKTDPLYGQGRFDELDEDIRVRERYFLANTLAGIRGYLSA